MISDSIEVIYFEALNQLMRESVDQIQFTQLGRESNSDDGIANADANVQKCLIV